MDTSASTARADPDGSAPAGAPARRSRGPRDMLISLLVLLGPLLLVVGLFRFLYDSDRPVDVDQAPAIAAARAAGLDTAEPTGLGTGWSPASAVFHIGDGGATLRLGYLVPDGDGAQVVQSTVPAERLLGAELTGAARPGGTVEAGGRVWQRYTGSDGSAAGSGRMALVLLEPDRTLIVFGTADEAELRTLAAALSVA